MAFACSTTISYLGLMAGGAMVQGNGFAPASQEIANSVAGAGNGIIGRFNIARNATSIDLSILGSSDPHGGGAFTNSVPESYQSTVGTGLGTDRINAHVEQMFGDNPIQMAQTMTISDALVQTSAQVAAPLEQLVKGVNFDRQPGLDNFEYPADGVFPNYLGSGYPDIQAVVTNGISTLVKSPSKENFELLAADLINLGTAFDLQNINTFGNPGQIVANINTLGGLDATGLQVALAKLGIDASTIYNLANSSYNTIMQTLLESITTPDLILNAQRLLGSNVAGLNSLADYLDFDKIFALSKNVVSFSTLEEFRIKLQSIELGRIQTVAQLGAYINTVETVSLPTIQNITNFTNQDYTNRMQNKFLGGTGPSGRITMGDMLGSLGGVGIDNNRDTYVTAMKALYEDGTLTTLRAIVDELITGQNGGYTVVTDPGPPQTIEITDPRSGTVVTEMSSFEAIKRGQIETELDVIYGKRNVNSNIDRAIGAWTAMYKKVFDEKDFQTRIDMNYDIRTNFPDIAYTFISNLKDTINRPGKLAVVNGMVNQAIANGDLAAEYIRAYIKELENRKRGDGYDIRWRAELCE